jgi:hypothetical protein
VSRWPKMTGRVTDWPVLYLVSVRPEPVLLAPEVKVAEDCGSMPYMRSFHAARRAMELRAARVGRASSELPIHAMPT